MIEEVLKPGSDVEEYIIQLERILDDKISSIMGLRSLMSEFKKSIDEEKTLNDMLVKLRISN